MNVPYFVGFKASKTCNESATTPNIVSVGFFTNYQRETDAICVSSKGETPRDTQETKSDRCVTAKPQLTGRHSRTDAVVDICDL